VIELPLPPKFAPPPPAFVPPVEVKIQAPLSPQPTITATVEPPPPAPVVAQRAEPPPAPPVVQRAEPAPAPAPVKAPAPVSASVACANYGKVMGDAGFPREALRAGLEEGSALIQFTLTANGEIKDIKAVEASHGTFARGAMRIVGEYQCAGQGRDIVVQVPFKFRSN
jgi:protein TonB